MAILALGLSLFQLVSCTTVNRTSPIYWDEDQDGSIRTNDVTRLKELQEKVPLTIILPEYLPGGLKSYNIELAFFYEPNYYGKVPTLRILLDSLSSARDVRLIEGRAQDEYPPISSTDSLAERLPDYTAIELAGIEVLEHSGIGTVVRSDQQTQVSSFKYLWLQNDLLFSVDVLGYDQSESRKIIESMIK